MLEPLFPILGFTVGLMVGMTGMGAGSLMTPILIFMGVPPTTAVGTDLIYAAISKVFGTTLHSRRGNIHFRLLRYLLMGGMPAVLLGSYLIVSLRAVYGRTALESLIGLLVTLILILVAAVQLAKTFLRRSMLHGGGDEPSQRSLRLCAGVGFLVGLSVQMTSVGSGVIIDLILLSIMVKPSMIVGTSLAFGVAVAALGGALHAIFGSVDPYLLALLTIGSIPGIISGVFLNSRIPVKAFRSILLVIILVVGAALALRYGSTLLAAAP